jgi:hypothetical protein
MPAGAVACPEGARTDRKAHAAAERPSPGRPAAVTAGAH